MKRLGLLLCMLVTSSTMEAKTFEVPKGAHYLEVIGVVDRSIVPQVVEKIWNIINSNSQDKDIYMLINSPGGAGFPGVTAVDVMRMAKERGYTFKCVSGILAASMAFILLAECNERYVLAHTQLLFHPVSTSIPRARVQELMVSMQSLLTLEAKIMRDLQKVMKLPPAKFHQHYFAETMWNGDDLAERTDGDFLTVVDDIKGIKNLFKYSKPRKSLFKYPKAMEILNRAGL